ncbi:MAG: CoA transferase, partial [Proteobacteria bacterium]|nr:CoA transferase [Pseudomonadota bacterium]
RPPAGAFGPFTDFIAPLFNVVALVAALDYKERTGRGQYLDLSQYECGLHFLGPMILDYTVNGREFSRRGNRSDCASPHGVYRCLGEDRWVAIAVFTDEEWQRFCEVIGNPSWCREARFETVSSRIKWADELDRFVEQWTASRPAEEVMTLLQAAGIPAGVALTSKELFEDPQLRHYEALVTVPHPEMGTCTCQSASLRLTKTPRGEIKRPDLLGEHTEYVCKELIGMSEEEYMSFLLDDIFV